MGPLYARICRSVTQLALATLLLGSSVTVNTSSQDGETVHLPDVLTLGVSRGRPAAERSMDEPVSYIAIAEQTAEVCRGIFGPHSVLEHHGIVDLDKEDAWMRATAEDWNKGSTVYASISAIDRQGLGTLGLLYPTRDEGGTGQLSSADGIGGTRYPGSDLLEAAVCLAGAGCTSAAAHPLRLYLAE
jgi:hypothetical protein